MNTCSSHFAASMKAIASSSLVELIPREWKQPVVSLTRMVVSKRSLFSHRRQWVIVAVAWDAVQPGLVHIGRFVAATVLIHGVSHPVHAEQWAQEHQRALWRLLRVYLKTKAAAHLVCCQASQQSIHHPMAQLESRLDGSLIVMREGQWRFA